MREAPAGGSALTDQLVRPASLVGARVARKEDQRFLSGRATYVDDVQLPGMLHAAVLRSPLAHAQVRTVDPSAAKTALVLAPADVAAATSLVPCIWRLPGQRLTSYPVVPEVARHVGEAIGLVVAATRAAAEDEVERVELELEPLAAVPDVGSALAPDAPLLYPELGTNVLLELELGDAAEVVEEQIARAAHVVARRLSIQRIAGTALEARGVVARWDDATGALTLWSSTQSPHHVRDLLATVLGLPAESVRVVAPDVGGAFGNKEQLYPEEVLVALASMRLGRPVKWIEDRHEALLGTIHARDHVHEARLALGADGRFLALHSRIVANVGSRASNVGAGPAFVSAALLPGPYAFEAAGATVQAVLTNRTPTGAYRGFGMQQATWVRERLVDEAARELGFDPVDLRLRNMIRPEQLPYTTRTHQEYECGDYPGALGRAAELIAEGTGSGPTDGRRRGIGFSSYVEFTGLGPVAANQAVGFHLSGFDTASVRMETDGSVTVRMGTSPQGQGHETTFAQLAAARLGVPLERVRVLAGDTATAPYSSASAIASRSMAVAGGALVRASEALRGKLLRIGAHLLEASAEDLELADGAVHVRGAPFRSVSLAELAEKAWLGWDLPEGEAPGLQADDLHDPAGISYSYATHAAAVAVDEATGDVEIERYVVVHDCGTVVNPTVVEGQIHGGVAQGIGIALLEECVYDDEGNPVTGSLIDYLVPSSAEVPDMAVEHIETPSPFIPGGMKGMGEGGTIGAPAAIGNAVAAALPEIAHLITQTPLSPARIWTLLRSDRD